MNMTHPYILKMERDGFLGSDPACIGRCRQCGTEIVDGDICYDDKSGNLFCCAECAMENHEIRKILC